ncbi:MAG: glycosyltransferase, partial [Sphingobacteriaceae bacterium]|nr:glycosyltransferase [Cytophagaceae bacterium]
TRAKRVVTIHGTLEPWALRKGRWKKELFSSLGQRRLLRRADLVHVNSAEEAADVQRYLGERDVPPLMVLGNGMRLSDYERVPSVGTFRRSHGIAPMDPIMLFLSRLNVKKGLDLLLPAALPLLRQRPQLRLVVAGPDDGYRFYVENFIRENGMETQVLLPGMLTGDEKLAAFRDADAFVLPSYSEGFSIAALEALTLGVPALLSDRVGFGEQLRENGASLLCELNVESVRRGLERLLDEPTLAADLRERGPRFVREFADINVVATRLYRAFEALLPGAASVETFP